MKVEVLKSFEKDIEKIADKKLAEQVITLIEQLEKCEKLSEIRHLKKMKAKGNYYRIRMGNFRLGLRQDENSVMLIRFIHRKDIYSFFP